MTAITLINKLAPTGLTIKQAIIIAERAEAIEAAAMRIKRESVGLRYAHIRSFEMTMEILPSKELLSAVLNLDVRKCEQRNRRILYFHWVECILGGGEDISGIEPDEINIYELAIKTKQKYPSLDLDLAATDISEFWRQANILVGAGK